MSTTNQFQQAAHYARVIAAIARDRPVPPATLSSLHVIANQLDNAANFLDTDAPGPLSSLPIAATEALWLAELFAEDNPATRLPTDFTNYVLHRITGRPLPFPEPMFPLSDRLALQEVELTNRLQYLHDDTDMQVAHPDEWLRAVLSLWQKLLRLAEAVREDNSRSSHQ
ncbi:hypothetical protein ACIHJG_34140 [Streptomyces sp. NPDC052415]|uniref:hypothetical protein n=1 Tax=Streptomyces sp. NPDC052415 TaxID=3365690 RepID=UPI0037D4533C